MSERAGGDWGFRKFAEFFQQMAGNVPDLRAYQELATWAPRSALEALIESVRSGLIGRRIETTAGGRPLRLVLSNIEAKLDPIGASVGQIDDVELAATQIEYDGFVFTEGVARLGNVHTRMGAQPALVCAPVDLSVELSTDQAARFAERHARTVVLEVVAPGVVRVRWKAHPSWFWLDLKPEVESGRVTLRPTALGARRWQRVLRRAWRPWTLPLTLPRSLRVVGLAVNSAGVRVELRVDEWRVEYQRVLGWTRRND